MESWCFSDPPSPPFTLLHATGLSVTGVAGLWPGSPWTGLWFRSPPWLCWWHSTGVCFWLLEMNPGRAACSASRALLTNSSLSVWTNCSVCSKRRRKEIGKKTDSGNYTTNNNGSAEETKQTGSETGKAVTLARRSGFEESTEKHLQRKRKQTRKMNTVLQHKEDALHYLTSMEKENNSNKQQTIQLLLLQPSSLRSPPPLMSNSPATVCCWSSWKLLHLPGVTQLQKLFYHHKNGAKQNSTARMPKGDLWCLCIHGHSSYFSVSIPPMWAECREKLQGVLHQPYRKALQCQISSQLWAALQASPNFSWLCPHEVLSLLRDWV